MGKKKNQLAITAKGLRMMIAGLLVLVAGFLLLSGGDSKDPSQFNYAMFDFRRLVLAPLVILGGVVLVAVSIMRREKKKEE
jgi:hypothetical protein